MQDSLKMKLETGAYVVFPQPFATPKLGCRKLLLEGKPDKEHDALRATKLPHPTPRHGGDLLIITYKLITETSCVLP